LRYKKQRDKFRCGPVAIQNALRWAGYDADLNKICLEVGCVYPENIGTWPEQLDPGLRFFGKDIFSIKKIIYPTVKQLKEHLFSGGAIIFRVTYTRNGEVWGHYTLIDLISDNGKRIRTVNLEAEGRAIKWVNRKNFTKEYCVRRKDPNQSLGWFLRKKNAN